MILSNKVVQSSGSGGTPPVSECQDVVTDYIAKYEFKNDTTDETGVYDGVANGGLTYAYDNILGVVANFDGVNDYIDISNLGTSMFTDDFTISLWIKTPSVSSISFPIGCSAGTTGGMQSRLQLQTSGLLSYISFDTSSGFHQIDTLTNVQTNEWFHIIVTKTLNSTKIYVEGIEESEDTTPFTIKDNTDILIGTWSYSNTYAFNGQISNLRLYDRVLSEEEVTAIYNHEKTLCLIADPTPQDYVAFYPLTGTAEDVTGNYDGTENGGLTYVDDATKGAVASFGGSSTITAGLPSGAIISMSMWCTVISNTGLFYMGNGSVYFGADYYAGSFRLYTYGGAGYSVLDVPYSTTSNTWYHCVFKVNDITGTAEMFVNGLSIGSATLAISDKRASHFYIGLAMPGIYATQDMSSFRVYDRALTQEEITTIYDYEKVTRHIPVSDGLVAYYPLKTNSMDNCYNQFDGTDTGVTYDGASAVFDGNASQITTANTRQDIMSITCFIELTSISRYDRIWTDVLGWVYLDFADIDTTKLSLSGCGITSATGTITLSTRHHVTVVFDGTGSELFVDGVSIGIGTLPSGGVGSTINISGPSTQSLNGSVSDFRIYNRALTQEEITTLSGL